MIFETGLIQISVQSCDKPNNFSLYSNSNSVNYFYASFVILKITKKNPFLYIYQFERNKFLFVFSYLKFLIN